MVKNKIALGSLALDLKRVAIGFHRGSDAMAERFLEEALKRKQEIDEQSVKPHIRKILAGIKLLSSRKKKMDIAEDALMYSTLLQNAASSPSDTGSK